MRLIFGLAFEAISAQEQTCALTGKPIGANQPMRLGLTTKGALVPALRRCLTCKKIAPKIFILLTQLNPGYALLFQDIHQPGAGRTFSGIVARVDEHDIATRALPETGETYSLRSGKPGPGFSPQLFKKLAPDPPSTARRLTVWFRLAAGE